MFTRTGGGVLLRAFVSWLVVGLLVPMWPCAASYGGGLGTAAQPYLIFTAAQLNAVGATPSDWDKCFKLMANIDLRDLGPAPFNPIGTIHVVSFVGVFDGNYKTISNLRLASDGSSYLGLFGLVDTTTAQIMNVSLLDPNIADESARYVGAFVGLLQKGTITNCHVRGGNIRGLSLVGGLVGCLAGENTDDAITDCTVMATVTGGSRVGGLLGQNLFGNITRCQAVGQVQGDASSWTIGGLIGENQGGPVGGAGPAARCRAATGWAGSSGRISSV